jgi:hypothetical protein
MDKALTRGKLRPKSRFARDFDVTPRTIDRWHQSPKVKLRPPIQINGRCYYSLDHYLDLGVDPARD